MTAADLPSLLVAGAMRCGTTTLHEVLGSHPDVYASRVKEPHHLAWETCPPAVGPGDRAFLEQVVTDPLRYRALFAPGATARQRVESSAMYLHVDGAERRAAATVPDAHVIVLLREPARRAYSSWVYQRMRAFEPLEDFDAALRAEPDRLSAGWLPIWGYRTGGIYAPRLVRWADAFGDRLHVIFLEELRADPVGVLTDLGERLGLSPAWPATLPGANASGLPRHARLQGLLQWRPPGAGRVLRALPDRLVRLVRDLRDRNVVRAPAPDPAVMARLRAEYRADIASVEDLLGRSVPTAWRD